MRTLPGRCLLAVCPHVRERPLVSSFFRVFLSFGGGRGHALQHVGSSFPTRGLNPHPLHWKHEVLTTGLLGKSLYLLISLFVCFLGCARSSLLPAGFLQLRSGSFSLLQCTGTRAVGFRSCGSWAWMLHGMWDLPGPGIEPVPPALAGGFFFFFLQVDS